ncbi:ssh4 [Candida margitis]|uniref:ssh4 n=1 Tax=Candida margitis TaxID=1775924 RepID=UPI002226CF5C|nr:ssh4 [Candida margitis]KAI5970040.1 ssh4 [Candida margitis]
MYLKFDQPEIIPPYNRTHGSNGKVSTALLVVIISLSSVFGIIFVSALIVYLVHRSNRATEDDLRREEENQAYLELNSDEQEIFFQSREFLESNPYYIGDLTLSQNLLVQEKGINAFEFVKDQMLTNNDLLIVNKTELNFFKKFECSTETNLPIPMKNEVYYYEAKIYSLPETAAEDEDTLISIGLGIKPYPWFRLPGRHPHSVSYDSDGYRRHNQPFPFTSEPPFPKLSEGDVVGVGYRTRSGTIFFTRNGKKVSESKIGGHIKNFKLPRSGQIFPIIGANNICSVHVNLGQRGFVFIEGNVKNWRYAPLEGTGPAPPAYNKFNADILLERSEIDEEEDDRSNDFPPDFWATVDKNKREGGDLRREEEYEEDDDDHFTYDAYSEVNSDDEQITLNSLPPPYIQGQEE